MGTAVLLQLQAGPQPAGLATLREGVAGLFQVDPPLQVHGGGASVYSVYGPPKPGPVTFQEDRSADDTAAIPAVVYLGIYLGHQIRSREGESGRRRAFETE